MISGLSKVVIIGYKCLVALTVNLLCRREKIIEQPFKGNCNFFLTACSICVFNM